MKWGWLELAAPISRCVACGEALEVAGGVCARCRERAGDFLLDQEQGPPPEGLVSARAAFAYRGCIRGVVRALKFGGEARRMAAVLTPAMIALAEAGDLQADLIVPVPLGKGRLRERGYNQASELAFPVGRSLHIPVREDLLWRVRATMPQTGLDGEDRARNTRGAFRAGKQAQGKAIILIDDVITTGSTASACAKALLEAGAARVEGLFAARALLEDDTQA